jgi:small subunit ribosomal protein S17
MAEEVENTELEETAVADASAEAAASDASADASTQAAADDAGADSESEEEVEAVEVAAAAPEAEVEPAAPAVLLTPKERKVAIKTKKAAKVGQRAEVTPEDRQAERDAARAKKAAARRLERAQAREKYKAGAHERTATPAREHETGLQKTRQGIVVSDKADKTITVRIDVARRHRRYSKIVRSSSTVHAHDETNDANIGDTVVVREARPLSRLKRWRLVQVVERAK